MEVKLAKSAGFCFGVKRAVDLVYQQSDSCNNVYTYGPIIHNEDVVNDLSSKGVNVINNKEELKDITKGTIIIRSHGVSRDTLSAMSVNENNVLDATCPYVLKIHKVVEEQSNNGRYIIVVGSAEHPEVQGIVGWCNGLVSVIKDEEEAKNLNIDKEAKVCIVSQTTFNYNKFQDIVEIISKKGYDILVLNTICNATQVRQTEAEKLAKTSDAMIVIGGKHSSNTKELYNKMKQVLKEREINILNLRFGLNGKKPKTVDNIVNNIGTIFALNAR